MGSIFEEMNQWLLGDFGRVILNTLNHNKLFFLLIVAFYGFLLLYSKIIYMYYIPRKMNTTLKEHLTEDPAILVERWQEEKKKIPWYIVIPTKNELWVRRLKQSDGNYHLLYFNCKNQPQNEMEYIEELLKEKKGDCNYG